MDLSDIAESEPPSAGDNKRAPKAPTRERAESQPDVDFLLGLSGSPGTTAALVSPSLADLARKAPSEPPAPPPSPKPPATRPASTAASATSTTPIITKSAEASTEAREASPAKAKKSGGSAGLWLVLGLLAVAGVAFAVTRKEEPVVARSAAVPEPEPPATVKPVQPAAASETEPAPAPVASAAAEPPVTLELPDNPAPAATGRAPAPAAQRATSEAAKNANQEPAPTKPAAAPATTTPKPEAAPAVAVTPRPEIPKAAVGTAFDRAAAAKSLATAASQASANCKKPGDPSGVASVAVTFAPSGRVTSATVSGPPFSGTATGGCIASTLRRAQIPAFDGEKVTVGKTIVIQ